MPSIQHGDSAVVRIDAYPNRTFTAEVTRIANSAVTNPSTRGAPPNVATPQAIDFEVIVTLDSPPPDLRPDLTATAEIVTAVRTNVLSVPIISVTVRDPEGMRLTSDADPAGGSDGEAPPEVEGVFILRDGRPAWVPVTLGIVGDWYFEVTEGLQGGETIIAGPYAAIRDLEPGAPVRVPPPPGRPAGS